MRIRAIVALVAASAITVGVATGNGPLAVIPLCLYVVSMFIRDAVKRSQRRAGQSGGGQW